MSSTLIVNKLKAFYGKMEILHDVSFSVESKSITAFIGPNGAGKSTLLKSISGLLENKTGQIFFENQDITNLPVYKIVQEGISLVPEERLLFPQMNVEENLLLGAHNKRAWPNWKRALNWIYELFPRLKERKKQIARSLSGGEQQMLTIGRGLMSEPNLLMLDEPFLGIAPNLVMELYETIRKVRENGVTILLIEQNVAQTLKISDFTYVMENGEIVMEGKEELLNDRHIKHAYLRI